jgi:hypothetical protein
LDHPRALHERAPELGVDQVQNGDLAGGEHSRACRAIAWASPKLTRSC